MDVLPTLKADSFDAMLTDPPYGLSGDGGKTGFMGQEWDGRVPGPEVWRECLRVLKPGALALVFGGTRTFHRLAVALEDAGFELRDTLMWVYGSGFPKSHDVSKAIDKMAGAKRMVVGQGRGRTGAAAQPHGGSVHSDDNYRWPGTYDITAPATPEAERWQGYGTSLKPAYEPILLVRKPTPLAYAQNALEHGTGALNIDGARVPGAKPDTTRGAGGQHGRYNPLGGQGRIKDDGLGRWPANLIHDGSEEVVSLFPSTASRGHTGSAARFFYTAKASSREREAGLDDLPEQLFAQSGGAQAALARGESEYQGEDASTGLNRVKKRRNVHPTVKPLALTRYLATLLLPPERDTPRRLLVPFAGSGSEMIGARQVGWDEAVGIELNPEYVAIAEGRIAHWLKEAA